MSLAGKTLFITGGSRGIGLAIALRAARDGANVAIAAKTVEPHPKLEGTIFTAAEAIESAGGNALPVACDVRSEEAVAAAIGATVEKFGGIDVLINNASAINLAPLDALPMKAFDLMQTVNARATYLTSALALPHLRRSANAHVLTLSPPLATETKWMGAATAYTMAKFGMTIVALGIARAYAEEGIASNALWPRTTIATAAVRNVLGGEAMIRGSRRPEMVADAAYAIITRPSRACTGNCFIDDEVLREAGVTDFDAYAVEPGNPLFPDIFLDG